MLSRTILYVLKALSVLGRQEPGTYIGTRAIGKQMDIPINYLGKMLRNLAKKGLVDSQKGLGGGFRLSSPPDKITLLQVIEAIEEEEFLSGCFWGNKECSNENPCPMHTKWKSIVDLARATFGTTTVADIMEKASL